MERDRVQDFLQAMRGLAATVCVVSARAEDGSRYAVTVTALASLSLEPPSLSISINKATSIHPVLLAGANFCVNVLAHSQEDISRICSGKEEGEVRFGKGDWQSGPGEVPRLADAQANIFCSLEQVVDYSSHSIFLAKVTDTCNTGSIQPLLYLDGQYRSLN